MLNRIFKLTYASWTVFCVLISGLSPTSKRDRACTQTRTHNALAKLLITSLCWGISGWAVSTGGLPSGAQVVGGEVSVQYNLSGSHLNIEQTTEKAIIHWDTFNIGQGASIHFQQPSAHAIILNRVAHHVDPSHILGKIKSNGHVLIVNPDGVLIGPSAQLNMGSVGIASLNMLNDDFLQGHYRFSGSPSAPITNQGQITVSEAGYVALVGGEVINKKEGKIISPKGQIQLGSGTEMLLKIDNGQWKQLVIDQGAHNAQVVNEGGLRADAGQVHLVARSSDSGVQAVVENRGLIEARALEDNPSGKISLLAYGGKIHLGGTLDASSRLTDGGTIETSGEKVQVAHNAQVTTQSTKGKNGLWQLDAADFELVDDAALTESGIRASTLSGHLNKGHLILKTHQGDIQVNAPVSWDKNELTLHAHRHIRINATMNGSKAAQLALEYGQGEKAEKSGGDYLLAPGVKINLPQGPNFRVRKGLDGEVVPYAVITRLQTQSKKYWDLQDIKRNLSGHYALGADIDAIPTQNWNKGQGFKPLGDEKKSRSIPFSGQFDGLGHVISGLYIDRSSSDRVGLFAETLGATLRNLNLVNMDITGDNHVGGLVGQNVRSTIAHCHVVDGKVSGRNYVGGLVGTNEYGSISDSSAPSNKLSGQYNVGEIAGENVSLEPVVTGHSTDRIDDTAPVVASDATTEIPSVGEEGTTNQNVMSAEEDDREL